MKNYLEFYNPVSIVSGQNAIEKKLGDCAKKIGFKNTLVISGPIINKLKITDFVCESLKAADINVCAKWTDVPNESSLKTVRDISDEYTKNACDSIVAVGGGSVLDTAKAVRLLLARKQNDDSFFGYNMSKIGTKIPFIAIPTTCGTGAEVTKVAVICDEGRGAKEEILSDIMLPDIALLDPKMLQTLPKKAILLTAFDALSHAIEGYCGKGKNIFSSEYSLLAIKLILQNLDDVLGDNPTDEGRLNMLLGATYAGISFSNSMVGAVHAIAHSAGSVLGIGHDFAVASFLPYVLKYNIEFSQNEYAVLFDFLQPDKKQIGLEVKEKAEYFVMEIYQILQKYATKIGGIPTLKESGLSKDNYEKIANLALSDGAILTNPRIMGYEDILNVLQMAGEVRL